MHNEAGSKAAPDSRRRKGFLTRLARDVRGNTLAIVGAALVPLAAMIGSGVDMSRAYMAKTRLQSACDAGALAGRRIMENDTLTDAVRNEARRFFNFNFRQGLYETEPFTPNVTRPESGTIRVTASTRIPTAIMHMFGFESLPLHVTCDASLNFVNTDVMLVLDVTGSMGETLGGSQKIVALRDAVMALYDELAPIQTQLQSNGMRLRYGVVPYSTTVNVGSLIRGANPDYLADSVTFRSRVANYNDLEVEYIPTTGAPQTPVVQAYPSSISQANCDKYGRNVSFSGFSPSATSGGGPAPTTTWIRAFSNNEESGVDWGWSGSGDTSGTTRACRRRYVQRDTTYTADYHYESSGYSYQDEDYDVSQYKLGGSVTIANDDNGEVETSATYDPFELPTVAEGVSTTSISWNGCIQERETVNTITSTSGYAIPTEAYDLNINLIPHDVHTRWRPMIPSMYYRRNSNGTHQVMTNSAPCPAASRRLTAWTRSEMLNYVNALQPTGNTYHDIGMIWGARMISSGGIFGDSTDTFNGMPVARHIIFMTDGVMDTDEDVLAFHGVERNEHNVGGSPLPSDTELESRHMQRFKMVCNAAKSMNASIWVIAFGSTLQPHLLECASNSNQASVASNRDQLIARFRQIGSNIGALRLTQ